MRSFFHKSILLLSVAACFIACDKDKPNYQYMPDMYEPIGYEAYGEYDIFVNGQEAKLPAPGSIPRGWMPYEYENTTEGRAQAKAKLTNPLPYTEDNVNKGKGLYTIYCAVCHGDNGDGQGILAEREKILGVPSYDDPGRAITEGSVYHVMYYGLNSMGSYAVQTSEEERWQIAHYVMSLKDQLEGNDAREFVEKGAQTDVEESEVEAAQENVGEENVLTETEDSEEE